MSLYVKKLLSIPAGKPNATLAIGTVDSESCNAFLASSTLDGYTHTAPQVTLRSAIPNFSMISALTGF